MDIVYNIRPMRFEDWDVYHEMIKEILPDDNLRKDQFLNSVKSGSFFVLESDNKMVGQLKVSRFGSHEAHLGSIGVAKSHQRKGWGRILMKYSIDWFKEQDGISTVHLYTQDYNIAAQSMYKKFGFKVTGTTWHYFIPFTSLKPTGNYICQEILEEEINFIGERFPTLPAAQIRRFLDDRDTKYYVLTLKNKDGMIVGAARFTPSFPGSFPFEIIGIDGFDDFMKGMGKLSLPEFNYVRTVFTDNKKLAKLCDERNYHLHHRLYKMSLNL